MKKITIFVLTIFILSLIGCKKAHVHDYKYEYNNEYHYKICECGLKLEDELHSFSLIKFDDLKETYKCKNCAYKMEKNHVLNTYSTATCTDDGSLITECENCGYNNEIDASKLNHKYYIDEESIIIPTFENIGSLLIKCENDLDNSHSIEYELRVLYSYYFWTNIKEVPRTCTEFGEITYVLNEVTFKDDLKDVYLLSDDEICDIISSIPDKLKTVITKTQPYSHSYNNHLITIDTNPTYNTKGLIVMKCDKCDNIIELELEEFNSNFYEELNDKLIVKDEIILSFFKKANLDDKTCEAYLSLYKDLFSFSK